MVDDKAATPHQPYFIAMLANNPKHIESNTEFLSREQANER